MAPELAQAGKACAELPAVKRRLNARSKSTNSGVCRHGINAREMALLVTPVLRLSKRADPRPPSTPRLLGAHSWTRSAEGRQVCGHRVPSNPTGDIRVTAQRVFCDDGRQRGRERTVISLVCGRHAATIEEGTVRIGACLIPVRKATYQLVPRVRLNGRCHRPGNVTRGRSSQSSSPRLRTFGTGMYSKRVGAVT